MRTEASIRKAIADIDAHIGRENQAAEAYATQGDTKGVQATELVKDMLRQRRLLLNWVLEP